MWKSANVDPVTERRYIGSCVVLRDLDELANAEGLLDLLGVARLGSPPTRSTLLERIPAPDRERWATQLGATLGGGVPSAVRHHLTGPDGIARDTVTTFVPIVVDGSPHGAHVVVIDLRLEPETGTPTGHRAPTPADGANARSQIGELVPGIVAADGVGRATALAIADVTQPDAPLVFVSPAFEELTGYSSAEALGRNCRFLQGPATEEEVLHAIREAIGLGRVFDTVLTNYRKDGSPFLNNLSLAPVRDDVGRVTHYIGYQQSISRDPDGHPSPWWR